jgi:hypothetical protein
MLPAAASFSTNTGNVIGSRSVIVTLRYLQSKIISEAPKHYSARRLSKIIWFNQRDFSRLLSYVFKTVLATANWLTIWCLGPGYTSSTEMYRDNTTRTKGLSEASQRTSFHSVIIFSLLHTVAVLRGEEATIGISPPVLSSAPSFAISPDAL